jgi:p-aminobenzoyl-glutamate transporter AbgT
MTWLYILLFVLLAAALSGYIVYRILRPRLVAAKTQDLEIQRENERLQEEN